jgi:hypothetical protein
LDHKRTWRYRVHASPQECVARFTHAFKTGTFLVKGNWEITPTSSGAIASYLGLRGFRPQRARAIEAGAVGSKVTFEVEKADGDGCTECVMWLSEHGTMMGFFTNDAGVFRVHMQAVEKHLRKLDPNVQVARE